MSIQTRKKEKAIRPIFVFTLQVIAALSGFIFSGIGSAASVTPGETLVVNLHAKLPDHRLMQGFLHGLDNKKYDSGQLDIPALEALRPAYWRIGMSDLAGNNYLLAKKINPDIKITLVLSDQLAILAGNYQKLSPWKDWTAYENNIREIIRAYRRSGQHIDYWDIWSEPDTKAMWHGSCDQAMETFRRAYLTIREADPSAGIVGPSVSNASATGACPDGFLTHFAKYITENDLRFDAISWHEFVHPEHIPAQAILIREFFKKHNHSQIPEMHINEYSGPRDAPIAGWAVGWLYYLEQARLDWANRACWNNGCQSTLDGLLTESGAYTPLYWVHRIYARLPDLRVSVISSDKHLAGLAGYTPEKNEITILFGQFAGLESFDSSKSVKLVIKGYEAGLSPLYYSIFRIPGTTSANKSLAAPVLLYKGKTLPEQDGTLSLTLPDIRDGDAYQAVLKQQP